MYLIIRVAHHYNRLIANLSCIIIALFWGLTIMSNENPSVREQVFHFKFVDVIANVNITMDLVSLKQCADVV